MKKLILISALAALSAFAQYPASIQVYSGSDLGGQQCNPFPMSNPNPVIRYNLSTGNYFGCSTNSAGATTTNPLWTAVTISTGTTGSGNLVLGTSPSLVTPALGTPASGVLTNATGLPGSGVVSTTSTGNQVLQVCHATYSFAVDGGGAPGLITPAANCTIPANSIIFNQAINWTTAAVGATNTTSIGTTGTGGGATILLGATAVGSLTGIVQGVIAPQTASGWKKITTAGTVTLTTATAALTAGICEIYVFYITSPT